MTHRYAVNDIYPCIQGEGANTGMPMALVRLHGCPVGCPFCDTKETWTLDPANERPLAEALGTSPFYAHLFAAEVAAYVREQHPALTWVLLTGGEPAEQPLKPLVDAFHDKGLLVALETSGTAIGHVDAGVDWVCVSPKIGMPGRREIVGDAVQLADEITWVVGRESDIENLRQFLLIYNLPPYTVVAVQPVSQSPKATALCIDACHRYGWRLSVQVHKYLSIR